MLFDGRVALWLRYFDFAVVMDLAQGADEDRLTVFGEGQKIIIHFCARSLLVPFTWFAASHPGRVKHAERRE